MSCKNIVYIEREIKFEIWTMAIRFLNKYFIVSVS